MQGCKYNSPEKILSQVNVRLAHTINMPEYYITTFLIVIHPGNHVTYCGAGHPPALVFRHREKNIEKWESAGMFLGAFSGAGSTYKCKRTILNRKDRLLLYTDGVLEAINKNGEMFGSEKLQTSLLECREKTLLESREYIINEFEQVFI